MQGKWTYKKLPIVLITFITQFSSPLSNNNNASIHLKQHYRLKLGCHFHHRGRSAENGTTRAGGCKSSGQSNFRLGSLFPTCCLQFEIPIAGGSAGGVTPGANINPVNTPNNPLSPLEDNIVANPVPTPWDFVATGVVGQYRFVSCSMYYHQILNGLMAFRIQENGGGRCWSVPNPMYTQPKIVLAPQGFATNQNWVLEFVG